MNKDFKNGLRKKKEKKVLKKKNKNTVLSEQTVPEPRGWPYRQLLNIDSAGGLGR